MVTTRLRPGPLYRARRTLHTGADLLTDKQKERLEALFATEEHVEVEVTWGVYQAMIAAYREPDRARGRQLMENLITSVSRGVPVADLPSVSRSAWSTCRPRPRRMSMPPSRG